MSVSPSSVATTHNMKPCEACNMTGFSDKVHRGVWTMEPKEKICPCCGGRGWVERHPEPVEPPTRDRHQNL